MNTASESTGTRPARDFPSDFIRPRPASSLLCSLLAGGGALGAQAVEPADAAIHLDTPRVGWRLLAAAGAAGQINDPASTPGGVATETPPADSLSEVPAEDLTKLRLLHEIGASGDFLFGQGHVTVPFNFSLVKSPDFAGSQVNPQVGSPSRESTYFGATVSYGYQQTWYLDLSYAQGSSSGTALVPLGPGTELPSEFAIDDTWYQVYLRYAFPGLRGSRLAAYLRGGLSFVTADLSVIGTGTGTGLYEQDDQTEDIRGNLGFGVSYALPSISRYFRWAFQVEGEGFYGTRAQESQEKLVQNGITYPSAEIDNTLYGGIARATLRFQYDFGGLKAFLDGGIQANFMLIDYDEADLGSFDELLWGPYVKVGIRYAF